MVLIRPVSAIGKKAASRAIFEPPRKVISCGSKKGLDRLATGPDRAREMARSPERLEGEIHPGTDQIHLVVERERFVVGAEPIIFAEVQVQVFELCRHAR